MQIYDNCRVYLNFLLTAIKMPEDMTRCILSEYEAHPDILEEPPVKIDDEKKFFRVVKAAFSQRRKTLPNSLSSGLSLPKAQVSSILESAGIKQNARAEEMSMQDFADITRALP